MKKEGRFGRIPLDLIATQNNVIACSKELIISKNSIKSNELSIDLYQPHILEGICFTLCTKGKGKILVNYTEYNVEEKMIGAFFPNTIIQVIEEIEEIEVAFIFFSFDSITEMAIITELLTVMQEIEKQRYVFTDDSKFSELLTLHKIMTNQFSITSLYRDEIVKGLLQTIVYQILRFYHKEASTDSTNNNSHYERIFKKFMSLLFQHYKTERSVSFYADLMCLTPKHFSKLIKEISGKTAGKWIDELVIMEAKVLLRSSNKSITDIALELNFSTTSFFSSYFKKLTNLTPLEYRNL
ncbi:helix-turn-helix domain-containing protein [Myroides injenensis]|uniref:helix-turn-helix domain-containing protein n=1 Tax=Myroides injenensis TaxID=1183151 RepID=UPI00028803C2|nr:AraC family transcriptional regulator [Myroides injenensis]